MKAGSPDYIPYNKALVLKGEKDESEELMEEVKELKKSLQDSQKAVQDRFDELMVCYSGISLEQAVMLGIKLFALSI